MPELTAPTDQAPLLLAIVRAYADGDTSRADDLFVRALDADLPWDEVCAAAARGMTRRYSASGQRSHA